MHAVWDQHIPALHCPGVLPFLARMSQTTTTAFELQNELVGAMNSGDCICVQNTVLSFPNISTATSHARNHEKTISFPNNVFALDFTVMLPEPTSEGWLLQRERKRLYDVKVDARNRKRLVLQRLCNDKVNVTALINPLSSVACTRERCCFQEFTFVLPLVSCQSHVWRLHSYAAPAFVAVLH